MASRTKRGEPCAYEDCGSRRFRLGDDGYTYCDQGHQQRERGAVIAEDTGEFVRTGRKARRRDSDAASTTSRASGFSGSEALEHYLLCLQLVLRKQLRWLIEVQKLPEELEVVVKDLWALRLQKLQGRTSYESDSGTERAPSREVFSSQSDSESQSASQASRRRRKGPAEGGPNLSEMLSLCYCGCLLLRSPVTAANLLRWVNNGELLYYRAAREVPSDLKQRLPAPYQALLEPQDLLKPESVHEGILAMLTFFSHDFDMSVPEINVPLVLFRWMQDLVLPIEVFAGTQRLASLLELHLKFDVVESGTRAPVLSRYPEVQLMALVVVATKVLFPFDTRTFKTQAVTDLSAVAIDWEAWAASHENRKTRNGAQGDPTFVQALDFTEDDCLESSEEQLDAYLDWCEENVASEDIRERGQAGKDAVFRRALFEMFPMRRGGKSVTPTPKPTISPAMNKSSVQSRPTDEEAPRTTPYVGEYYRRFRSVDDLSGPAKLLFEDAATLACVSLESMVQAVFMIERRLQKVEDRLRKAEHDD